jgi:hypothetical protein
MVYSILSPWFWLAALGFSVGFFFSCYLPGAWWVRRFRRPALEHVVLSTVLGIVLWAVQGYLVGYLQLRWLSFIYVAVFAWLSFPFWEKEKQLGQQLLKRLRQLKRQDWPLVGVALIGASTQLIQVFGTGLAYGSGVAFFRVNAYDGMLHLSFIQAIIRQFPPTQPGAIGLPITNYHYWSDLVMAELSRVWSIPVTHSFFQFWPIILTCMTSLAVYIVVRNWGGSRSAAFWSLFFLYFGADAVYLITLIVHHQWGFQVAAIDNGATQFLNIPHSFAKMIFLTGLIPLTQWLKDRQTKWGVLTLALLAPVVGFKVYFGMFAGVGFGLVTAWLFLRKWWEQTRKSNLFQALGQTIATERWNVVLLIIYGLVTLAIFLPPNQHAGGLFWSPLEWPKLFLGQDHINIPEWWLRKQVYEEAHNWKGIIAMDAIAIGICLLAVYGTRMLGFLPSLKWYRQLPFGILVFLIPGTLLFTFLGLYTLQTSGLFNVFNFFAVACVPLALLSGLWVSDLFSSKHLVLKVLALVIVITTLPHIGYFAYDAWDDQIQMHYDRLYTPAELAGLAFLRTQTPPDSLVQSHPNNFLDRSTPYVSFFSNRQTFLTGVGMLDSHNQPIAERKRQLENLFAGSGSLDLSNRLKALDIDYLYLQKRPDQTLHYPIEEGNLKTVFENEDVTILQPM